jgi:hypothetical protein
MIHKIKVDSEMYNKVKNRRRMVEIRPAFDRHFRVGDTLHYCEVNENGEYTGRELKKAVIYVIEEMDGLEKGYALLALIMKKGRSYLNRMPKDI